MRIPIIDKHNTHEYFDDMFNLDTVRWTTVDDSGTGTNTADAIAGGQVTVKTAASDNDYHFLRSATAAWLFAAGKPLWFEARFALTEANTDDANLLFGLSSVIDGTVLGDDGAGPAASYSGALFFKVDGTMKLQFETSNAGTQVTNATLKTFVSDNFYRVGFHFDPGNGVTGRINPWIYDDVAGSYLNTVKSANDLGHDITLASLAQMNVIFGVKAGGANAEQLRVDYIRVVQQR